LTGIVVDASVALAWCFPDEASEYADGVLVALEGRTVIVPAIWALEITNALLVGERRKRVRQPDIRRFVELLRGLTITEHSQTIADTVINVLPLARASTFSRVSFVARKHSSGIAGIPDIDAEWPQRLDADSLPGGECPDSLACGREDQPCGGPVPRRE
jgi:predicted nucleic acid-binding protein